MTSLVGSLSGAFAGAVAAQRIIERSKLRDELIREIRNTNAAIAVAFGICNSLLCLKQQYVKDLKFKYDNLQAARLEHDRKRKSGEIPHDERFAFELDLQTFQALMQPTDILRELVFEKLSVDGCQLNLVIVLIQAIHGLDESIEMRENLIEKYRSLTAEGNQDDVNAFYLGLHYGDGHISREYPSLIEAIATQTDDGIACSKLLCQNLSNHGEQLLAVLKKNFRTESQSVDKFTFSKAESLGLMPDETKYTDWLSAFKKNV